MKVFVLAWLLAASALAQVSSRSPTSACGQQNVSFRVKLGDTQDTVAQPGAGKALVYFIHEAGTSITVGYPTVKIAMDGAWLGANHGNSYFPVTVDPGEHHLCVSLQSSLVAPRVELAHFTAESGTIYYYRTRLFVSSRGALELLDLEPIDSDQGNYLVRSLAVAASKPKK